MVRFFSWLPFRVASQLWQPGCVARVQHSARFVVGFPVGVYSRVVVFLHVTKVAPRAMRCTPAPACVRHFPQIKLRSQGKGRDPAGQTGRERI